jgi:hypothetical protein
MNSISVTAFTKIAEFELMLRRFVRWQLISKYGRGWIAQLSDEHYQLIEKRIQAEKKQGIYWSKSSELSFLSLGELIQLIFRELWRESARTILNDDYGLRTALQGTVLPLRNKVAHFRAIDSSDLALLRYASELEEKLRDYYSSQDRVLFYLSSDPQLASEQNDPEIQQSIISKLHELSVGYFWDEYGKFEGIRALKFGCGLGIYDNNLFIDLDTSEVQKRLEFCRWFNDWKYTVSSVVSDSNNTKIFFPLKTSASDVRKLLGALQRFVSSELRSSSENLSSDSEYVINPDQNRLLGLAF